MIKNSDIIFWSSIFFVVSWLIGFFAGIESMILIWSCWFLIYIIFDLANSYHKYLQKRFD